MAKGAKANGNAAKAQGKGKQKKTVQTQQKAPARTKIFQQRVTGTVSEWKGKFGWIVPSAPIKHAQAGKHQGKLYLGQEDVEQEISGVGASVSFFVYTDGSGIGAMNVRPGGGQGAKQHQQQLKSTLAAASAPAKGGHVKVLPSRINGTVKDWKGKFGWITPSQKINHPGAAKNNGSIYFGQADVEIELTGNGCGVSFFLYADSKGLAAKNVRPGKAGAAGKQLPQQLKQQPKQKAKAAVKKPQLKSQGNEKAPLPAPDKMARTPVSTTPVTGQVVSAHGKFAFIKPDEVIDHPKLKRGQIFLHADDVETDEFPKAGAQVTFFIFEDSRGLGAESCQVTEQGDGKRVHVEGAEKKDIGNKMKAGKMQLRSNLKAKKVADAKKDKGPSGPELPRERVSKTLVTGEVVKKMGKFGWIQPAAPVSHPDVDKKNGQLYFHMKDVTEGTALEKGSKLQFHIYKDASGLGAEEVSAV